MIARLVSLEDDENFWELMEAALVIEFPHTKISWFKTESLFCAALPAFIHEPPDLFILDVMVKWADPAENMPIPPPEVDRDGYYCAGIRCRQLLASNPKTAKVPVILYTVLERKDLEQVQNGLPDGVEHLGKDTTFDKLIRLIHRLDKA